MKVSKISINVSYFLYKVSRKRLPKFVKCHCMFKQSVKPGYSCNQTAEYLRKDSLVNYADAYPDETPRNTVGF